MVDQVALTALAQQLPDVTWLHDAVIALGHAFCLGIKPLTSETSCHLEPKLQLDKGKDRLAPKDFQVPGQAGFLDAERKLDLTTPLL